MKIKDLSEKKVNELSPETRKSYLLKAAPLNRANPTATRSKGINRALLGPSKSNNNTEMQESDISGLLAASHLHKSFIITAQTDGKTKKFRVHAQSEQVALDKFNQHYSTAKVVNIEEEGVKENQGTFGDEPVVPHDKNAFRDHLLSLDPQKTRLIIPTTKVFMGLGNFMQRNAPNVFAKNDLRIVDQSYDEDEDIQHYVVKGSMDDMVRAREKLEQSSSFGGMLDAGDLSESYESKKLDELSPQTLRSYAGKARGQGKWAAGVAHGLSKGGEYKNSESDKYAKFAKKRFAGADKADSKLGGKSETEPEYYDWSRKGGYGTGNTPVKGAALESKSKPHKSPMGGEKLDKKVFGKAPLPDKTKKPLKEDSDEARELFLYAENDSDLYRTSFLPIVKNLEKKFKKGVYDKALAAKLWKYHADRAAKKYGIEHASADGFKIFSPSIRREVAEKFATDHFIEMDAGNFHDAVKEQDMEEGMWDKVKDFGKEVADVARVLMPPSSSSGGSTSGHTWGKGQVTPGGPLGPIARYQNMKKNEGVAEGLDPDTQRLEQEVRDALANGDDYTAKSLVKMAHTAADRNYLRKIIRQEMYGTGPGQGGVAEGLNEMDKSAPQPGRDGKVSHSTYGSRDKKGSDYFKGKEAPGKAITAKQASKDALDILKKQGVAEDSTVTKIFSGLGSYMQKRAPVVFKKLGITVISQNYDGDEDIQEYKVKGTADAIKKAQEYLENEKYFGGVYSPDNSTIMEDSDAVIGAITQRIVLSHPELLRHGPEAVMDAINDVAHSVGQVDEIGTSDVSGWVKQVAEILRTGTPKLSESKKTNKKKIK